jgi:hypothetical protein
MPLACAMLRRALPEISATSAIHEHSPRSPEAPFASSTQNLAVMLSSGAFAPSDGRRMRLGWRELLAESRQSSFLGAGPDRLAPHRCRPFTLIREGSRWTSIIPIRLARTPSVVSSWSHRLERPITRGAFAPFPSPPWTWQSIGRPAFARPAAGRPAFARRLARGPASRVPPRRGPRSAEPKVSSIHEGAPPDAIGDLTRWTRQSSRQRWRVDLCPQLVPNLWTRVRAFSSRGVPRFDKAGTGEELDAGRRSVREPMRLAGSRSALRTSAFRSIRGSMCRRTSTRENLSFAPGWQPKNRLKPSG